MIRHRRWDDLKETKKIMLAKNDDPVDQILYQCQLCSLLAYTTKAFGCKKKDYKSV